MMQFNVFIRIAAQGDTREKQHAGQYCHAERSEAS